MNHQISKTSVELLFDKLCDLPEPERAAFLDQNTPDPEERAKLVRLLTYFDAMNTEFPPALGEEDDSAL